MQRPVDDDGSDEEVWLTSYADMMSLLLCFFILFFSISTAAGTDGDEIKKQIVETFVDQKSDRLSQSDVGFRSETKEARALQLLISIMHLDNNEDTIRKIAGESDSQANLKAAKRLLKEKLGEDFKSKVDEMGKEFGSVETVDIILPSKTLFDQNSALLTESAKLKLLDLLEILKGVDELSSLEVAGHSSMGELEQVKNGPYDSLWVLSSARAGAVAGFLVENGFNPEQIEARGYGSTRPIFQQFDATGKPLIQNQLRNRRIEFTLKKTKRKG